MTLTDLLNAIRKLLPANRVVAISTWLVGLAALILGVVHTLPLGWQNTALAIAGVLKMLVIALKFLDGSQKWEAQIARAVGLRDIPAKPADDRPPNPGAAAVAPPVRVL